jgi:hypothetical protein
MFGAGRTLLCHSTCTPRGAESDVDGRRWELCAETTTSLDQPIGLLGRGENPWMSGDDRAGRGLAKSHRTLLVNQVSMMSPRGLRIGPSSEGTDPPDAKVPLLYRTMK